MNNTQTAALTSALNAVADYQAIHGPQDIKVTRYADNTPATLAEVFADLDTWDSLIGEPAIEVTYTPTPAELSQWTPEALQDLYHSDIFTEGK